MVLDIHHLIHHLSLLVLLYDSEEENTVGSYGGDSGIIVGFGTTTVGVATRYQLVFDLHIPASSDLRNSNITGTAVTISGISTGDYFIVNDSNVGCI